MVQLRHGSVGCPGHLQVNRVSARHQALHQAAILQHALQLVEDGICVLRCQHAIGRAQGRVKLREVVGVGSGDQGFVQAQHFQRVVPTAFDQTATHKTGGGHAVPEQQLAHAVTQHDLGLGCRHLPQAVAHITQPSLRQQVGDRVESLRMPGHQHQQRLRRICQMRLKRRNQRFVFAHVGAARRQHRSPAPGCARAVDALQQRGRYYHVGLDVAGNRQPVGRHTQCSQPRSRHGVRGAHQAQRSERRCHEAAPARVAGGRARR